MGFVSPAADYAETRLDLNYIFIPNPANTFLIETPTGAILVDRVVRINDGDLVAFQKAGYPMLGKWHPHSLITEDGEALEGETLEDVIVIGKVTVEVLSLNDESRSTI